MCDHCGTMERAVTIWPKAIHDTCPCECHKAWHYDQQRLTKTKRKSKK